MASRTSIDTDATGTVLAAAGQTSAAAIDAGTPAALAGSHITGSPTALSGLLDGHLVTLSAAVATGTAAAAASVAGYRTTEHTNEKSLST